MKCFWFMPHLYIKSSALPPLSSMVNFALLIFATFLRIDLLSTWFCIVGVCMCMFDWATHGGRFYFSTNWQTCVHIESSIPNSKHHRFIHCNGVCAPKHENGFFRRKPRYMFIFLIWVVPETRKNCLLLQLLLALCVWVIYLTMQLCLMPNILTLEQSELFKENANKEKRKQKLTKDKFGWKILSSELGFDCFHIWRCQQQRRRLWPEPHLMHKNKNEVHLTHGVD